MLIIKLIMLVFTSNIVFSKALGISTMTVASKNKANLISLGIVISFFTGLGSVLTYFADRFILKYSYRPYITPIVYIIIIGIIYILSLIIFHALSESLFDRIKKYIHYSAFNTVVLGTLLLSSKTAMGISENPTLIDYAAVGFISGLGFLLASFLLKISLVKLDSEEIPKVFRGYPILLIYLGIISMALYAIK